MDKEELLHVLWDARDWIDEFGLDDELDQSLITRIETQMDLLEDEIWKGKYENTNL